MISVEPARAFLVQQAYLLMPSWYTSPACEKLPFSSRKAAYASYSRAWSRPMLWSCRYRKIELGSGKQSAWWAEQDMAQPYSSKHSTAQNTGLIIWSMLAALQQPAVAWLTVQNRFQNSTWSALQCECAFCGLLPAVPPMALPGLTYCTNMRSSRMSSW